MDSQKDFNQSPCALLARPKKQARTQPVGIGKKGKRLLAKRAVEKGRRIRRMITLALGILAGLCALLPQLE